jgi:hypothetical protein
MSEFEFEFDEFSRHFQNSYSPNIREFEYEFELGEFFPTPGSRVSGLYAVRDYTYTSSPYPVSKDPAQARS